MVYLLNAQRKRILRRRCGIVFYRVGVALAIILLLSGCGYRFSGSGDMPGDIQTLFISLFENRTGETRLENLLTNAIIFEFTRNDKDLIAEEDAADAIMGGVIKSISSVTVSRRGQTTSVERRITVTVDFSIVDKNGTAIWSAANVRANQTYDRGGNKQISQSNRDKALVLLSEQMAEFLYNRLTDDF